MFLITAYPRSGTAYMAELLQAHGLKVGHEHFRKDGLVSWLHISRGHWLYLIRQWQYDVILHQVRHPLKTIASAQTLGWQSYKYMAPHLNGSAPRSLLEYIMQTYIAWHKLIKTKAHYFYRVEDVAEVLPQIFALIGHEFEAVGELPPSNANTRAGSFEPLEWADLYEVNYWAADEIYNLAAEYGY